MNSLNFVCKMFSLIVFSYLYWFIKCEKSSRPNIVFIVSDDLGWDDVSHHGSRQLPTPNIDVLARAGVSLRRHYAHCACTPSRAALLTGKYAHRTDVAMKNDTERYLSLYCAFLNSETGGMQGYPLTNGEDRGLPLTEKILPQYLRELGYATHLVGKWHVGSSRRGYLPTERGFDTHYGHRVGFMDYYEYTSEETWSTGPVSGVSLFRDSSPDWAASGYVTYLYTDEARNIISSHDSSKPLFLLLAHNAPHSANAGAPLQAPPGVVRALRHVESPQRRLYAAMVKKLDDSVGEVIEALRSKNILNNTIVVFISDNGAPTEGLSVNYGLNTPLRGNKMTPWEGGIRTVGLIWTQSMKPARHLWDGFIHVVDWLPTLLRAVNADVPQNIDGIDLWDEIWRNEPSKRREIIEIDDYTNFSAIISGDFKLLKGNIDKKLSAHLGEYLHGVIGSPPSYENAVKESPVYAALRENVINHTFSTDNDFKIDCGVKSFDSCFPTKDKVCLFNIIEDPCEMEDIAKDNLELVETLLNRLRAEEETRLPRTVPLFRDPEAHPRLFNYTWDVFYS